jgi:hypothetical protein
MVLLGLVEHVEALHYGYPQAPSVDDCRLFQQSCVDAFAACDATALDWLRSHQKNLRAEVYGGLQDHLIRADVDLNELGRRVVLPSSFTGGDRSMQHYYYDSMAIVRKFGRPSIYF